MVRGRATNRRRLEARIRIGRSACLIACLVVGLLPVSAATAAPPANVAAIRYQGLSLATALERLRAQGLELLFSSELVPPALEVAAEPTATSPRQVLDELLRPHGLTARETPGGRLVVVRAPRPSRGVRPAPAPSASAEPETGAMPVIRETIVVSPPGNTLVSPQRTVPFLLDREALGNLPRPHDDTLAGLAMLPGGAAGEDSARFSLRGGHVDQVMVVIDGLEVPEPYHLLADSQSSRGVLPPDLVEDVNLTAGSLPARYGDRLGGVLDLRTVSPRTGRRTYLGLTSRTARAGASGLLAEDRGLWFASARLGAVDEVSQAVSDDRVQRYGDVFLKAEVDLSDRNHLRGHGLLFLDDLKLEREAALAGRYETENQNTYLWLAHEGTFGASGLVETVVSGGRVDRERRGTLTGVDRVELVDERYLELAGLRQDWSFGPTVGQRLALGFELRHQDVRFDYRSLTSSDLPAAGRGPGDSTEVLWHPSGEQIGILGGVYLADQVRIDERVTLDLGLRYDWNDVVGDRDTSPRLGLAWAATGKTWLRVGWGHFRQSQRPYELQVEDGETELSPTELAEELDLSLEHSFSAGLVLRLSAYDRRVGNPRPRYENLARAVGPVPELEPDRFRIAPERSRSRGLELFLRGKVGQRLTWWTSSVWSEASDHVDGRDVRRSFDQPYSFTMDLDLRLAAHWNLSVTGTWHTGWPITAVSLRPVAGADGTTTLEPVFGAVNAERLPDYHRLDLQLSRSWRTHGKELSAFLQLDNVYDRRNLRGTSFEATPRQETWGGFAPSFGISLDF